MELSIGCERCCGSGQCPTLAASADWCRAALGEWMRLSCASAWCFVVLRESCLGRVDGARTQL